MSKLTREQYDAVHAILKAHFGGRFQSDDTIDQVAEHLQFPLEPATDAEVKRFSLVMEKVNLGMAFDDFIDTRNKYRIPAPVDPRHKVVV